MPLLSVPLGVELVCFLVSYHKVRAAAVAVVIPRLRPPFAQLPRLI